MRLDEVLRSGKKFRRKGGSWFRPYCEGDYTGWSSDSVLATDWEIEMPPREWFLIETPHGINVQETHPGAILGSWRVIKVREILE